MLEKAKEETMKRAIRQSGALEAVANIIAGLETELLDEVAALEDAAGIDHIDAVPDQEERRETLLALVQAKMGGDPREFYVSEIASQHVENAADAKPYLGLDPEEWESQIATWAESYRSKGAGSDMTDREIAEEHVRRKFGVSLSEFERNIVEWEQSDMLRRVLAGNVETAIEGVGVVRSELEGGDGV